MTNRTWRRTAVCWSLVVACAVAPVAAASDPPGGERAVPAPVTPAKALVTGPAIEAALQAADPVAQWQTEIAAARVKRSAARKQQYSGLGVAFGGYVMMLSGAASGNCSFGGSCGSHGMAWAGLGVLTFGTTMGILGSLRAHDADGEVNAIIARGPQKTLSVSVGPITSVGYRVTW